MQFAKNDLVEIEASQLRALARVRNVEGNRIHIALERGGYLPWTDDPVLMRQVNGGSPAVPARIVHASGATALIELLNA